jgi:hypothetical protein
MHPVVPREMAARDTREHLADALALVADCEAKDASALAELLYAGWYARPRDPFALPRGCPPDLVETLRAAHVGFRQWEGGWQVEHVGARGQAVVKHGVEVRLVERSDYSPSERPGLLPQPGDHVSVTCRRDRVDPADGWWRTAERSWSWVSPPAHLVRLYLNVELIELPALVERLTALLATEDEPWLLKCAVDPRAHARADATVAYLTPVAVERRSSQLVELTRLAGAYARTDRPPLTMPVVPGLAVAVDPGPDESFGVQRCRLIAEAAVGPEASIEAVLERFARDDPQLPWER